MLRKIKAVIPNSGFRRYFLNTSWLFLEQGLRILSNLFVGVWVARFLGPEQFGILSYALSFTSIFAGVAKLGLNDIIVRELINLPGKHVTYLGTAFWLKIIGSIIVIGFLAIILPFCKNDSTTNTFIFIVAMGLVFNSFEVIEFYFQSQLLAKIVTICKLIQLALSSLIKIYLIIINADLIWFVVITSFDALGLAAGFLIAYRSQVKNNFYRHFNFNIAKQLLSESWPLIISSIVVMVYMRIDQIMINEMLGKYEVGIYSAAVKLSEVLYFVPTIISTSLFPALIKYKQISAAFFYEKYQYFLDLMFYLGLLASAFLLIFSKTLVLLIFGNDYIDSADILVILAIGTIFVYISVAQSKYWIIFNLQRQLLIITAFCALLNIILNYITIPIYGIKGASISTVISYLAGALILPYFVPHTRKMLFHTYSTLNFIRVIKCLIKK